MKYIVFLLLFLGVNASAEIDWSDKEGALPYLSFNMIESFKRLEGFCSEEAPDNYSKLRNIIDTIEGFHRELFPNSSVISTTAGSVFTDALKAKGKSEIKSVCFSAGKDVSIPGSKEDYFKLISLSFDKSRMLTEEGN